MANLNYTGDLNPGLGWKPQGALAGMLYRKDRQRYDDVASLQDALTQMGVVEAQNKLADYQADSPVRAAERLSKIATANATAATIGPQKQADLAATSASTEGQGLLNQYNLSTLPSRISEQITKAAKAKGDWNMEQLTQGVQATQLALAMVNAAGPAGIPAARAQLARMGFDPDKDPVLGWALSGPPQEAKKRLETLGEGLNLASQQFRTEQMKAAAERSKALAVAGTKTGAERAHEQGLRVMLGEVQQDPAWTSKPAQLQQAEALRRYLQASGAPGRGMAPADVTGQQAKAKALEEQRGLLTRLRPGTPLHAATTARIQQLEQELAGATGRPSTGQPAQRLPGESVEDYLKRTGQ